MKKNRQVAQKQEGKGFSVKNKTYFERNEETVCGLLIVVSVESMRSLLRLPILIIKIKKPWVQFYRLAAFVNKRA